MATQYETDLVSQYGTGMQDFINSQRGLDGKNNAMRGVNVDSQDVNRILSGFQSSPYSGQNVVNAVAGGTTPYNYDDPYGAMTAIEQRLGLGEATTAEQEAQAGLLGFQDTTRAQINALRANRNLSTGLEAGFEAQRTREATQQEQVLSNQLALAQNKRLALESKVAQEYDVYNQERSQRESIMLQAIQAGAKNVNMGMSTAELTSAYTKASEEKAKQEKKDAYRSDLKEILRSLGKSPGKMNIGEMEDWLSKNNKNALAEAKKVSDLEYQTKLAALNKAKSGSGAGDKELQKELAKFNSEATKLRSKIVEKKEGWNWGTAWQTMKNQYPDVPNEAIDEALGMDLRGNWFN